MFQMLHLNGLTWMGKHPLATLDQLGILPEFLDADDVRPAREQINDAYDHGGGWMTMTGFTMAANSNLKYPGDPELRLLWEATIGSEIVRVYEASVVAIVQPDGMFEAARID